jgi:hypothetical protein
MNRASVMLAAVSGLVISAALAQAPAPPTAGESAKPGNLQIVNSQAKDQMLASQLKGMSVIGSDDQKIGSVVDILMDKSGQVKAYIVGVGGVLGLGAKQVAIEPAAFQQMPSASGSDQLKMAATKEQLAQATEFKPYQEPTTTGAAPTAPTGSRPGGAPPTAPR